MINKKIISSFVALSLAVVSFPTLASIYLGAQVGYNHAGYDKDTIFDHDFDEDGKVARGYIGYQFTPFFGVETGFGAFSEVDLPSNLGEVKTAEWDLLFKAGMPIGSSGFKADVKGGFALIMSDFDSNTLSNNVNWHDRSENDIRFAAGATLTYFFNRNFGVDVSYLHIFGDPNSGVIGTPNIDTLTLGLSVQFCLA